MSEVWYRIEAIHFAPPLDEYENPVGQGHSKLFTEAFPVIRHTPRGVWLNVYGEERFVCNKWRKRFACPTTKEALESFIARKRRQIAILQAKAASAERDLRLAEVGTDDTFEVA